LPYAGKIHSTLSQCLKRCLGIVIARNRHQSDARSPNACRERRVKQSASRFAHQRPAILQNNVVNEQVAH
jgi:hypothetical protein